jgi:hypothetical protein
MLMGPIIISNQFRIITQNANTGISAQNSPQRQPHHQWDVAWSDFSNEKSSKLTETSGKFTTFSDCRASREVEFTRLPHLCGPIKAPSISVALSSAGFLQLL